MDVEGNALAEDCGRIRSRLLWTASIQVHQRKRLMRVIKFEKTPWAWYGQLMVQLAGSDTNVFRCDLLMDLF